MCIRDRFGPDIACEDDRDDASTICPAVDQVTDQSDTAELSELGWYATYWRVTEHVVATLNAMFHESG